MADQPHKYAKYFYFIFMHWKWKEWERVRCRERGQNGYTAKTIIIEMKQQQTDNN